MLRSFYVSYSLSFPGPLFFRVPVFNSLWLRPVYAGCIKHNDSPRAFIERFKFVSRISISVNKRFKFVLCSV